MNHERRCATEKARNGQEREAYKRRSDTLANQSAVILFSKLSSWPSKHQALVLLSLSLTDYPVQLFKDYKHRPSIQQPVEPVKY